MRDYVCAVRHVNAMCCWQLGDFWEVPPAEPIVRVVHSVVVLLICAEYFRSPELF